MVTAVTLLHVRIICLRYMIPSLFCIKVELFIYLSLPVLKENKSEAFIESQGLRVK